MKEKLKRIREPQSYKRKGGSIAVSSAILLLGIALGLLSKRIDDLALDSSIGWHRLIERLDLGNVFSLLPIWLLLALIVSVFSFSAARAAINTFLFFGGMCAAYHFYTVRFSGFDPSGYMMIWYAITVLSPVFAVICWYAKGKGIISTVLSSCILAVLFSFCFSIGWVYFGLISITDLVIFLASVAVLFSSLKQTAISLSFGFALSFLISPIIPFR
ncbi:MAG: hypothetical protein IJS17_06315 [Clostridia bacterium]|nr:hypothetical protein [Clostridia bacterium]